MLNHYVFTIEVTMPDGTIETRQNDAAAPGVALREVQECPQIYGLYGVPYGVKLKMRVVKTSAPFCGTCGGNGFLTYSAHPNFCSDYEVTCPSCDGKTGKPEYD